MDVQGIDGRVTRVRKRSFVPSRIISKVSGRIGKLIFTEISIKNVLYKKFMQKAGTKQMHPIIKKNSTILGFVFMTIVQL